MRLPFIIILTLIFIVGCSEEEIPTLEGNINEYSKNKETILNYFDKENIVVFQYMKNHNKIVVLGGVKNNTEYIGNKEVAVTINGTDNSDLAFFYNDQYIHPISKRQYVWGMVKDTDVSEVTIEYFNDEQLVFSDSTGIVNNLFLTELIVDSEGPYKRKFVLKGPEGEVIEEINEF
ncbi:hypothetical protein RZN25_01970 [Bacillaceae bacterium S4-13-56]